MRFTIDQRFHAPPDEVARAYADPALYLAFQDLPKMSRPEVLAHEASGDEVGLQIRYRFSGQLSSAARAVLDPDRLTWVEHAVHDLKSRTTTFTMVPDHYADRFACSGSYRFEAHGEGTRRHCEGDIKVRALLVGGAVENAIVSGLREHLDDEVGVVDTFLAG
ncbi:MAG: DUF2505 family protein [Acidimicrobiales bacterium]